MEVGRCSYFVPTTQVKTNGENLIPKDYFNIGYMAGRFGINLDGDLNKNYKPSFDEKGIVLNINCCTADLFEKNMNESGIKFDVVV